MLNTKASNNSYVHAAYKLGKKEEENSCEPRGHRLSTVDLSTPRALKSENFRNYETDHRAHFC